MPEIVESSVFLLNRILDLSILIDWPDQREYLSRHALIIEASEEVAEVKITKSSAKRG